MKPSRGKPLQFSLQFLMVLIVASGILLAIPVFGASLVLGVLGVLVFLGMLVALQIPIFYVLRRWLRRDPLSDE